MPVACWEEFLGNGAGDFSNYKPQEIRDDFVVAIITTFPVPALPVARPQQNCSNSSYINANL